MLINWNLNKTSKSSPGKKDRISKKKHTGDNEKIFESEFQSALESLSRGENIDVNDILNQLTEIENNLIDNPNSATYFEFQSFVKGISVKLMNRAFKLTHFKDSKKKQFEYVRIIDENLKELYNQILSNNANKSKITSIMGSIRGIILDLSA